MANTTPANTSNPSTASVANKGDIEGLRRLTIANATAIFSEVHRKELGLSTVLTTRGDFEVLVRSDPVVGQGIGGPVPNFEALLVYRSFGGEPKQSPYRTAARSYACDTVAEALNALLRVLATIVTSYQHYEPIGRPTTLGQGEVDQNLL